MVSLAKKNSFRHTGAPKRVPKLLKKVAGILLALHKLILPHVLLPIHENNK